MTLGRSLALFAGLAPALAAARAPMPTPWSSTTPDPETSFTYGVSLGYEAQIADGDVRVSSDTSGTAPDGAYLYLRFRLVSKIPQPQRVRVAFEGRGETISRDVELGPSEVRNVVLPVPSTMSSGAVRASGPGIREGGKRSVFFGRNAAHSLLVVGSASGFEEVMGQRADTSAFTTSVQFINADELADSLAPYLGYDEVVLLDASLGGVEVAARTALEAYAATGGTLVLAHPEPHPESHLPLWAQGTAPGGNSRYGFGRIFLCEGKGCESRIKDGLTSASLPVHPHGPVPSWARSRSAAMALAGVAHPAWGDMFLLPEALAPLGRFLLIIVAFTLAIGPGSLWIARRKGGPAVLLFIPGTAFATCLALVGYSVVHDGFTLHGASRSLTLLDRPSGRAITLSLDAYYANLAPSAAQFDTRTAMIFPGEQAGQTASIDWTHGPRFGSGFIPSRTYREWGVAAVQPSRARLIIQPEGKDRLRVRNALGAPVRLAHLSYGGKLWRVTDLRDGGEAEAAVLTTAEPLPPIGVPEFEGRFDSDVRGLVVAELKDKDFLADLSGPAFVPEGGLHAQADNVEGLVRGKVDAP
jgi:hypothetical protein